MLVSSMNKRDGRIITMKKIYVCISIFLILFSSLCSCSLVYTPVPNEGKNLEDLINDFFPDEELVLEKCSVLSGNNKEVWTYPSHDLHFMKLVFDNVQEYQAFKDEINCKYPDDYKRKYDYYSYSSPVFTKSSFEFHIKDISESEHFYNTRYIPICAFSDDKKTILFMMYYEGGGSFESIDLIFDKEGGLFPNKDLIYD